MVRGNRLPLVPSLFFMLFALAGAVIMPAAAAEHAPEQQQLQPKHQPDILIKQFAEKLEPVRDIVEKDLREGKIPGAVIVVGTPEGVVYRRAFGYRSLEPRQLPMTEETIFDVASLTKVVATTTAIMQLAEKGKLRLDAPVARYWPAFRA